MDKSAQFYDMWLQGDADALEHLVRLHRDGLILYLCGIVGDVYTAEELAEDTFVKLLLKRPKNKGGSSFKTWLYTIGRNLALDHLRRQKKRETISTELLPETAEELSLEESYLAKERKILLYRAMRTLSRDYRQVLWLRRIEGLTAKETGVVMGRSPGSVDVLLHRAQAALRQKLEKEGFLYEEL